MESTRRHPNEHAEASYAAREPRLHEGRAIASLPGLLPWRPLGVACWFAGPAGNLVFDTYLFSFGESLGTAAWDVQTAERLLTDEETRPMPYHPTAHSFLSAVDGGFRVSRLVGTT